MAMTKWGRKETIIWPPHSPIYTYGAVFTAVVLTGFFIYCRFSFGSEPLQRFYAPTYIRSTVTGAISTGRRNNYRMLMLAAHGIRPRLATNADVSDGTTPEAGGRLWAPSGAVVRAARERAQHQEKSVNSLDRVRESVTFSRDKNFEREAVVDERALIRDGLRRGMGDITHAQVRANLDARLASGEFQIVERPQSVPGRQFTTAKTIEAEHEIICRVREGQNQSEAVLSRPQAITLADRHPHLNRAQKTVVEDVLSSRDRIQGIQGFAGAGKTTALTAIRNVAERQGHQVEGFVPTSRAARQLKEAGIEARTLQAFLARGQDTERNLEQNGSSLLMSQASPAPTRCANSSQGLAPMTACF